MESCRKHQDPPRWGHSPSPLIPSSSWFAVSSPSSPDCVALLPLQMPTSVHNLTHILTLKYPYNCLPSCPLVLYILALASLLVKCVWSFCSQTYMASIMLIVLGCLNVPCLVICSGKRKKEDIKFIFMSLTPSSDSGTSTLINNIS